LLTIAFWEYLWIFVTKKLFIVKKQEFMKTIKLFLILSFLLAGSYMTAFAQTGAAKLNLDAGTLDKAKEKIDEAIKDEKEATKAKTWLVRGQIYARIAADQSGLYSELSDDPINIALESFAKAKEMDYDKEKDKKGSTYKDAEKELTNIHSTVINYGVGRYQAEDLEGALNAFLIAQTTNPQDTIPFMYAADLAYGQERFEDFEKSITKALEMDFKGKTRYYMLYSYYLVKEKEEKEKALEVAEKGLKLDPNLDPESYKQMQSIALQLYLDLNKIDEALEGMQSSLAAASTDEDKSLISFNVGVLYEKKGDKEKALAAYTKSNELKPNFDALFNSGAMFFNEAVEIKKETDQMSLDEYNKKGKAVEEKAKVEFEKALPYFEKLYKMPEGKKTRVLGPLAQIYRIMGDTAKAEKLTDELETLED